MNGENSSRPSRWEAHRNALLLSLAFSSLLFGFAFVPVADAYTYSSSHSYTRNISDIYTDWDNPGWIKLQTTGYSNGQKLDAIEYYTDFGGDSWPWWQIAVMNSGTTKINDYERIAWAQFYCLEWFFGNIRVEEPILNTRVDYLGGGGFSFTDYTYT
jgi:hypothetical protein